MSKSILITIVVVACVLLAAWYFTRRTVEENNLSPVATPTPTPVLSISESPAVTENPKQTPGPVITLSGGLKVQDLVTGTGAEAKNGKTISVHYVGTLENGKKFDSSVDRGQPFNFVLGSGQVIQGWEKGFVGMKVGGKRKLIIPPSLGYGSTGAGNMISPNATLIFEVELLGVSSGQ